MKATRASGSAVCSAYIRIKIWLAELTPQMLFALPTEICFNPPGTCCQAVPVHLKILLAELTPHTVPSAATETLVSAPEICCQPVPAHLKILPAS